MFDMPLEKREVKSVMRKDEYKIPETSRSSKLSRISLQGLKNIPITFENCKKISKKQPKAIYDVMKVNSTPKNFNENGIRIKIKYPRSRN